MEKLYRGRVVEKTRWDNPGEYLQYLRHKRAYLYAAPGCKGKVVLDYGCGSGYGSLLLAREAASVVALDVEEELIALNAQRYEADNLSFQLVKPGRNSPFNDNFFDVIVSFQVIEHVPDVGHYLGDLKRVLKKQGILFITTPNRKHRLLPGQKPWNPDHLREYSLKQLSRQLHRCFERVEIYGIQGSDRAAAYERGRTRQTPFKAYIKDPLKRLLGRERLGRLRGGKAPAGRNKQNPADTAGPDILNQYSLKDYFVVRDHVDDSLDFLAVCREPGR